MMDWSPEHIADFGPQPHRAHSDIRNVDVLWPVYAWRVLFSKKEIERLDPFRILFLRMTQAGIGEVAEIARLSELDPELVDYIAASLQGQELVDRQFQLTQAGKAALDQDAAERGNLELGWVIQDALSGEFFPIFVLDLPTVECEVTEKMGALLEIGTKGKPRRIKPFVLYHGDLEPEPAPPTPSLISRAIERHRRAIRRHKSAKRNVGIELTVAPRDIRPTKDAPWKGHLRTLVYMTPEYDDAPWFVADPFGFGGSEFLRQALGKRQKEGHVSACELLRRLMGNNQEWREAAMNMAKQYSFDADLRLAQVMPLLGMRGEETVRETLKRAYTEFVRLEDQKTSHESNTLSTGDVTAVYVALRQAVEDGLELLRQACPIGEAWRHLAVIPTSKKHERKDRTNKERKEIIKAHACVLGFSGDAIPNAMFSTKFGKVEQLAKEGSSANIRPLLAALCLSAPDYPKHPLRAIAAENPRWLAQIDDLASQAGDVIHSAQKTIAITRVEELLVASCNAILTLLKSIDTYRKG